MIQSIIDGVIAAIRTKYDSSYHIYTEAVKQGLKEPCFFVKCVSYAKEKQTTNRYSNSVPCNITYFPCTDEPIAECMQVCEALYDLLELISVEGHYLRGTGVKGQVVDGLLQFQVSYSPFMVSSAEENDMVNWLSEQERRGDIMAKTLKFSKEQILSAKKYADYTDFLNGNLLDGKTYTKEEVEKLINDNYGKGKSEKKC